MKQKFLCLTLNVFLFLCPQLAEYRQRKAHADSQKKQKKKKKKKPGEDPEGHSQGRVEVELNQSVGGEEVTGGGQDGSQERNRDPHTTEFTFTKTLRSGETVRHDQTYNIEVDTSFIAISQLSRKYAHKISVRTLIIFKLPHPEYNSNVTY